MWKKAKLSSFSINGMEQEKRDDGEWDDYSMLWGEVQISLKASVGFENDGVHSQALNCRLLGWIH